jgi:hypothetical protein
VATRGGTRQSGGTAHIIENRSVGIGNRGKLSASERLIKMKAKVLYGDS